MISLRADADLTEYNSFGFPSCAEYLADVECEEDLVDAVSFAKARQLPRWIIGGGSNLVLDTYIPGVVIKQNTSGYSVLESDDASVLIQVAAGQNWHELVEQVVDQGWSGIENLALIPGTVGAAPVQNIGAYGVELKDCFESLRAFDTETETFVSLSREQCSFGYRDSLFKSGCPGRYLIVSVNLRLHKQFAAQVGYGALADVLSGKALSLRAVFDAVVSMRKAKLPDPSKLGNAGSFFENPLVREEVYASLVEAHPGIVAFPDREGYVKLAAGWLIDNAGWKGAREGGVGVYEKQALVLVNHGEGTAADLKRLAGRVKSSVHEMYGVELVPEPRFYP